MRRILWLCLTTASAATAAIPAMAQAAAQSDRTFTVVCRDAGAGGYEAFPDICRTADGELLCVFYAGFHHVSLPSYGPGGKLPSNCPNAGRICLVRSRDNGRTWSKPQVVIDTPRDDRDPSLVQLDDGTLLCNYFSHTSGRGGQTFRFVHSALVRSTDGGRTWSQEQPLFDQWACSSPIRKLSDGRLALPLYYVGRPHTKGHQYGGVSFSTDKGRTWSDPIPIGKEGPFRLDAEPDIVELPGRVLLAGLRPTMAFSRSQDGGQTWSTPTAASFTAHNIYFLLTSKRILLMAHRIPGTSVHFSLDQGKTWSENLELDPEGGACPSMVELPDGSIFCVYYAEGPQADIRAVRFQADAKGITIIPPDRW